MDVEECARKVYEILDELREEVERIRWEGRVLETDEFEAMVAERVRLLGGVIINWSGEELIACKLPENPSLRLMVRRAHLYAACGGPGVVEIPLIALLELAPRGWPRLLGFKALAEWRARNPLE